MGEDFRSGEKEVENKERIIVGTNEYITPEEDDNQVPYFMVCEADVKEHLENLRTLRRTRKAKDVASKLEELHKVVEDQDTNLTPLVISAARSGATAGEISGTIRMAHGYPYDPYGELKYPF